VAAPSNGVANCDNAVPANAARGIEAAMSDSLKTLLIVGILILILWNLGAGLYYMLVDKGTTKRTVNSLTKRIGLSIALILLVVLAIHMGWIAPHGVGRAPV
jgi:succinate dehydrogenase/fumarate reductase cytochrome b subunit